MPIHDWTRVRANRFHDFHQGWTVALSDALNSGRLPSGYFSMLEPKVRLPEPDIIQPTPEDIAGTQSLHDAESLPLLAIRSIIDTEPVHYARKANRITIYNPKGRAVSVIEVVSPGDKLGRRYLEQYTLRAVKLLQQGIHLLIVDLFPPERHNPHGIHGTICDWLSNIEFTLPSEKPLTLVSYAVGYQIECFIQPIAVGAAMPNMPIFLTDERYLPCPLEATYQNAWDRFPTPLKGPLESPGAL